MIWIGIIFALAGAANGAMDSLHFKMWDNVFPYRGQFWDPVVSWENKHHSKIPFATSIMVWMTDGWHLFKTISMNLTYLGVGLAAYQAHDIRSAIITFLVAKFSRSISFHITFHHLLMKTFWKNIESTIRSIYTGTPSFIQIGVFIALFGILIALSLTMPFVPYVTAGALLLVMIAGVVRWLRPSKKEA